MVNPSPQAVSAVVSRHDDLSLTTAAQSTGVEMPVLSAADSQLHAVHDNEHCAPNVAVCSEDGARVQLDDDDDVGLIAAGRGAGRLRERMSEDLVVRCCGIVRRVSFVFVYVPQITLPR
jgi:hypothetical protein